MPVLKNLRLFLLVELMLSISFEEQIFKRDKKRTCGIACVTSRIYFIIEFAQTVLCGLRNTISLTNLIQFQFSIEIRIHFVIQKSMNLL